MPIARLDRVFTLYGSHILRTLLPRKRAQRLPILMYHSVTDTPEPDRSAYYKSNISPPLFEKQLQFLVDNGYTILSLQRVEEYWTIRPPSEKAVILTFDDGYENWYTHAFPLLQKYKAPATMFLTTDYIGETNRVVNGNSFLNWQQVRALNAAGISLGSHTVSHPKLNEIAYQQVEYELRESKRVLEDKLQCPVTTFAYPFAFPESASTFKSKLRKSLQRCGYTHGVTTILGTTGAGDDPLLLRRLPINQEDDLQLFQAKLDGSYDWLHSVQFTVKTLKRLRDMSVKPVIS